MKAYVKIIITIGLIVFCFGLGIFAGHRKRETITEELNNAQRTIENIRKTNSELSDTVKQLSDEAQGARDESSRLSEIIRRDRANNAKLEADYRELESRYAKQRELNRELTKAIGDSNSAVSDLTNDFGEISETAKRIRSITQESIDFFEMGEGKGGDN